MLKMRGILILIRNIFFLISHRIVVMSVRWIYIICLNIYIYFSIKPRIAHMAVVGTSRSSSALGFLRGRMTVSTDDPAMHIPAHLT